MIVLRNKTFSSAKQKALRKAFDLQKGLASKNGEVVANSNKISDIADGIRRLGRQSNQVITGGKGVNASINTKANRYGSQAVKAREPETAALMVNSSMTKNMKITRHRKPAPGKKFESGFDQKGYDHDSLNRYGNDYDWNLKDKKDIMKSKRK